MGPCESNAGSPQINAQLLKFLSSVSGTKVLVSYNYDTHLERALGWENYGRTWIYPSKTNERSKITESIVFSSGTMEEASPVNPDEGVEIYVLKPHGSLNWIEYKTESGENVIVAQARPPDLLWERGEYTLSCFSGVTFTDRRQLIVAPVPGKSSLGDVTFYHVRLMLETLRLAYSVISLGWSCPVSDANLEAAIAFQFFERTEPLLRFTGLWMYPEDAGKAFSKTTRRFRRMFPAFEYKFDSQGITASSFLGLMQSGTRLKDSHSQ